MGGKKVFKMCSKTIIKPGIGKDENMTGVKRIILGTSDDLLVKAAVTHTVRQQSF